MTDYTWPATVYPGRGFSCEWQDNTVIFASPLSGTTRTESRPGGRWVLSIPLFGLMNETQPNWPATHLIEAFLFRLNGAEHRAVIPDFSYARLGPGGGTPLVKWPDQTGLSLITDGWPNSTTVLNAGDRIGISNQMIPLAIDATTDGSGQVTLVLTHPIRSAPADNAPLEIDAPTARYILTNKVGFTASPGIVKTALVSFAEAIP